MSVLTYAIASDDDVDAADAQNIEKTSLPYLTKANRQAAKAHCPGGATAGAGAALPEGQQAANAPHNSDKTVYIIIFIILRETSDYIAKKPNFRAF